MYALVVKENNLKSFNASLRKLLEFIKPVTTRPTFCV